MASIYESLSGIMTSKLVIRESESPRPAASSIPSDFTNDEFLGHYPIKNPSLHFIGVLRSMSIKRYKFKITLNLSQQKFYICIYGKIMVTTLHLAEFEVTLIISFNLLGNIKGEVHSISSIS